MSKDRYPVMSPRLSFNSAFREARKIGASFFWWLDTFYRTRRDEEDARGTLPIIGWKEAPPDYQPVHTALSNAANVKNLDSSKIASPKYQEFWAVVVNDLIDSAEIYHTIDVAEVRAERLGGLVKKIHVYL